MQYNIVITKGDIMYVAQNLELGVVSQGETIEQAVANIKEATELYLEDSNERVFEYNPALLTNITIS
jgi:predicted RNase H-like HicB family nuclease